MSAILILLGCSILIAAGFLTAFIWSVVSGQYEDDYTPSIRVLFENENNIKTTDNTSTSKTTTTHAN